MSIMLLTCDRQDRHELLTHCKWQVSRFVSAFDEHLIVDYPAKNDRPDLTERVRQGYEYAKVQGYDWVAIIENDDLYKPEYLTQILNQTATTDFIGSEFTYYYNLRNRTWERTMHPNHSSLFCTAFRVSAMKDFKWNLANKVFLDVDLWRYARKFRRTFVELPAIGIKHGIGLCGGKGHVQVMANKDPDLAWLKSKIDEQSFSFYESLIKVSA